MPSWGQKIAWIVTLVLGVSNTGVRAEFVVGNPLPSVSLPATDGTQVRLALTDGVLSVKSGTEDIKPAAVIIHLLQPDCLQCRSQLTELQAVYDQFHPRGAIVLGIGHRGDMKALEQLKKDLSITFPFLHGISSEIAEQFAAGDSLGIADKAGIIRYAQVGFGKGDEALWVAALEEILAGKPVTKKTTDRERLAIGDRFPAVELPSLNDGKPIALLGTSGKLTFVDDQGRKAFPKAAVGFFSRY